MCFSGDCLSESALRLTHVRTPWTFLFAVGIRAALLLTQVCAATGVFVAWTLIWNLTVVLINMIHCHSALNSRVNKHDTLSSRHPVVNLLYAFNSNNTATSPRKYLNKY